MIIKWVPERHGTVGFHVVPEDYDGTPSIANFWLDVRPKSIHWDRQAVAAFLIYGRAFGGPVTMPHKFSPAVSNAIKSLSIPVQLDLQPIEYYPKAIPIGERRLHVFADTPVPQTLLDPHDQSSAFLEVLRSDKASGAIRRLNGISVASNAWLHSSGRNLQSWYPYIAIACLFAEDLDVSTIVLPSSVDTSSPLWSKLCDLLSTARLGLEIEDR